MLHDFQNTTFVEHVLSSLCGEKMTTQMWDMLTSAFGPVDAWFVLRMCWLSTQEYDFFFFFLTFLLRLFL